MKLFFQKVFLTGALFAIALVSIMYVCAIPSEPKVVDDEVTIPASKEKNKRSKKQLKEEAIELIEDLMKYTAAEVTELGMVITDLVSLVRKIAVDDACTLAELKELVPSLKRLCSDAKNRLLEVHDIQLLKGPSKNNLEPKIIPLTTKDVTHGKL